MTSQNNRDNSAPQRSSIIQTVQTPLGFFTLVVLVVEVILGITANLSQGADRTYLIVAMIALIFLLVFLVAIFAYFRPEALHGVRPTNAKSSPATPVSPALAGSHGPAPAGKLVKTYSADPKLKSMIPPWSTRYRMIEVPDGSPLYRLHHALTGLVVVSQIPFYLRPEFDKDDKLLGHHAIVVQPGENNAERVEQIDYQVDGVSNIHFLIAAGHGWAEHAGVQFLDRNIGRIELVFDDKSTQPVNLVLGKNVREWAYGNSPTGLVREIDYLATKPAWLSYDDHYLLDILSVSIDNGPKDLVRIRVVAKFEEDPSKKIKLPSIIISGITCERAL